MAAIITPWIDIIAGRLTRGSCALSMTDSTTSQGWLRKTNFTDDDDPLVTNAKIAMSREHAARYMDKEICDYSQWFPGSDNNIADALSRDFHVSDEILIKSLHELYPSQVPTKLKIAQLPNEIVCWMTSLLRKLPVQPQLREKHKTTTNDHGTAGNFTANQQDSKTTFSSNPSPANNDHTSSARSPLQYEKGDIRESLQIPWLSHQSKIPSITWSRPSGVKATQTPHSTMTNNCPGF